MSSLVKVNRYLSPVQERARGEASPEEMTCWCGEACEPGRHQNEFLRQRASVFAIVALARIVRAPAQLACLAHLQLAQACFCSVHSRTLLVSGSARDVAGRASRLTRSRSPFRAIGSSCGSSASSSLSFNATSSRAVRWSLHLSLLVRRCLGSRQHFVSSDWPLCTAESLLRLFRTARTTSLSPMAPATQKRAAAKVRL